MRIQRTRAGAFTLVETLLASTLTFLVILAALQLVRGLSRGDAQLERHGAVVTSTVRLRDRLGWDLARAVASPAEMRHSEEPATDLSFSIAAAGPSDHPVIEHVHYHFDASIGCLFRDGARVAPMRQLSFRRSGDGGRCVEVEFTAPGDTTPVTVSFPPFRATPCVSWRTDRRIEARLD